MQEKLTSKKYLSWHITEFSKNFVLHAERIMLHTERIMLYCHNVLESTCFRRQFILNPWY